MGYDEDQTNDDSFLSIEELTESGKINLLIAYDDYIQSANDSDAYLSGWRPVCINEFLNTEFLDYLVEQSIKGKKQ